LVKQKEDNNGRRSQRSGRCFASRDPDGSQVAHTAASAVLDLGSGRATCGCASGTPATFRLPNMNSPRFDTQSGAGPVEEILA